MNLNFILLKLYLFIPLIIGLLMNMYSSQKIKKIAEKKLKEPYVPLPDIIHHFFFKIPVLFPDYFLLFSVFLCCIYQKKYINLEKNILCVGYCIILRSFFVFFTILPSCMESPQYINKKTKNNYYKKYFLSTHDLMFSGHSIFFIGISSVINSYLIEICGLFMLVLSKQHYTIDVIMSKLIYFFIYEKIIK